MDITMELTKFNITDVAIAELRNYLALKIDGLEDKEGYKKVHEARMVVKGKRVEVTKTGKALREEANAYNKAVLAEEKRIINMLEPIETHLENEEKKIDDEKDRIKREAAEKEAARIRDRAQYLFSVGMNFDGLVYSYLDISLSHDLMISDTDEQFEDFCSRVLTAKVNEERRLAEEKAAREAETERLKAQAEEQDAREKVLREAEAKLQAEKKAIEDALKAEDERIKKQIEIEQAKKEAVEKAIRDKQEKDRKEQLAAERKAARAPDKEKLEKLSALIDGIQMPTLKTNEGSAIRDWFFKSLIDLTKELRIRVREL